MAIVLWISLVLALAMASIAATLRWRIQKRYYERLTNLGLGGLRGFVELATKGVQIGLFEFVRVLCGRPEIDAGGAVTWLLALLAYDFLYYWSHRASHRSGVLWASHAVHHQATHMDLTVGLRVSATNSFFNLLFFLPLAAAGLPTRIYLFVTVVHLVAMTWLHTERIGPLRWLERWINTPALHRVHHSAAVEHHDRNFGGLLIIWDRMFGTYTPSVTVRSFGIAGEPAPGLVAAHIQPWRELFGRIRRAPSVWDKARALL